MEVIVMFRTLFYENALVLLVHKFKMYMINNTMFVFFFNILPSARIKHKIVDKRDF
jgi:hypothetical protein